MIRLKLKNFTKKAVVLIFVVWILLGPQFGFSNEKGFYHSILWNYLEKLCSFGPRFPGTLAHQNTQKYLIGLGERFADEVVVQDFEWTPESGGQAIPMKNIEFRFKGKGGRPFLIGAHYDTRPWADQESDPEIRTSPILGANDGGSGTAVLLALAQTFHERKPEMPVHLVFFDGEDYGKQGSMSYLLGSENYARELKLQEKETWPQSVLIIDMVGDENLEIFRESYSMKSAPKLVDRIFDLANNKLKFLQFKDSIKYSILDDHVPFTLLNIPSAVLIDFDYPHWHKLSDTLERCSADSLFAVYSVVAELVYNWDNG